MGKYDPVRHTIMLLSYVIGDHLCFFFFSSRRRHTRFDCDRSSDVCSSDLKPGEKNQPASQTDERADSIAAAISARASVPSTRTSSSLPCRGAAALVAQPR